MTQDLDGMASLSLGSGPPLLFLPGLTPTHAPPHGFARRFALRQMKPFAIRRQVWWVGRRQGLGPDTTMADIADDYATALQQWGDVPLDVLGISTGGSVALQLAADHPHLVRRLVLVSSACRLGAHGRAGQRGALEALESGRLREAGATVMRLGAAGRFSGEVLAAVGWLAPRMVVGEGGSDLRATIRAEDRFDATPRLATITAPTLVVAGDRDAFYGEKVFQETARLLPEGRLLMYRGKGHIGVLRDHRLAGDVNAFLG
jgi:pimeloyl-ACP methyl ester carboxylesterase